MVERADLLAIMPRIFQVVKMSNLPLAVDMFPLQSSSQSFRDQLVARVKRSHSTTTQGGDCPLSCQY